MNLRQLITPVLLSLAVGTAQQSHAYDLKVQVLTKDAKPLLDAVVYAEASELVAVEPKHLAVDQRDKAFMPHVLAVPVGTRVDFLNTDTVNHYVYSFSDIKTFQFKLFKHDSEIHQVVFDKAGLITLGCNIHDFMLGYIFIAPSPYVGVSDNNGTVTLKVPDKGDITLHVWHERSDENLSALTQTISVVTRPTLVPIKFLKNLKPIRRTSADKDDY